MAPRRSIVGQRDRRRARRRAAARARCCGATGSRRSPASTRARSRATCATTGCLRGIVTAPGEIDVEAAIEAARAVPRWEDQDFVAQVSPAAVARGRRSGRARAAGRDRRLRAQGEHRPRAPPPRRARPGPAAHGDAGGRCWRRDVAGVVLSPGPGDPARLDGPVALARAVIDDGRPLLGICLGHQIVGPRRRAPRRGGCGSAITARTIPVQDLDTGYVQVTAQNHEVQVIGESLPADVRLPRQPAST